MTGTLTFGSGASTGCGAGSPMYAELSTDQAAPAGEAQVLQYTPPAGSTLAGGVVDVSLFADGYGYDASGTATAYAPAYVYPSGVFSECAYGLSPCANGTNDLSGELSIPSNTGGSLFLAASCGSGYSGTSCSEGGSEGAWSLVRVHWAHLLLSNESTPAASNTTGGLLAGKARGTQDISFTASDANGPGVYNITAALDGKIVYTGTPDSNGGACAPVASQGGVLMFDRAQPCRQSESVDLPVETAAFTDGQHTLKVTVTDAAGNSSVVYDAPVSTLNAPAAPAELALDAPGQLYTGTAISVKAGSWTAPSGAGSVTYTYGWEDCDPSGANCTPIAGAESAEYKPAPADVGHTLRAVVTGIDNDGHTQATSSQSGVVLSTQGSLGTDPGPGQAGPGGGSATAPGVPNGAFASENALLYLGVPARIAHSYRHRAFQLDGRLLNKEGHPILGATLEVTQQLAGSSSPSVIATVETGAAGEFTLPIPAGPSRTITVSYRALSTDSTFAAQASVRETVPAYLTLHVSTHHTGSHETVTFTGNVAGPLPAGGVTVYMRVRYRGRWRLFAEAPTSRKGAFEVAYRFEGSIGRFPFRAEVKASQAGFAYAAGHSGVIDVRTN
jgi:hypothetical protein